MLTFESMSLYFGYTQKSFWQVYDAENSRPFRETNYNPEVFLRFGGPNFIADLGYEHESNGQSDPMSRSWDRVYLTLALRTPHFKISIKSWYITTGEKYGDEQIERADDMKQFYGDQELMMTMRLGSTILKYKGRLNFSTKNGYHETMYMIPLGPIVYGTLTYSKGYGDNLRDYDTNLESFGVGFLINP